ncbi:putative tpa: polyketide [Diaporthe ampelina]|uniref:Putative tpa: polyketide n=1 Tax=Diaporthe ampelina TaxID=1214573 RepID=A0A0G2F7Q0_9PEZI|nr:putative tpa: polyketide [Diaporthe ampelina]
MTLEDWQASIRPKVTATWNLHWHFSKPGLLDFFVIFSSLTLLARWRVSQGLPAVSLDIGWVKNVGASDSRIVSDGLGKSGQSLALSEETVMQALSAAILHPLDQPQVLVGLNPGPGPHWDATSNTSPIGRDARFMPMRYRQPAGGQSQAQEQAYGPDGQGKPLSAQLKDASSPGEAEQLVADAIATKLADIFMRERDDVGLETSPVSLGVDSLVSVELRNMLVLKAGADVPTLNILQSVSLAALAVDVVAKSTFVASNVREAVRQ